MYDSLIVDLLDLCLDLLDEDLTHLIENQLKCLTGQPAESVLDLNA